MFTLLFVSRAPRAPSSPNCRASCRACCKTLFMYRKQSRGSIKSREQKQKQTLTLAHLDWHRRDYPEMVITIHAQRNIEAHKIAQETLRPKSKRATSPLRTHGRDCSSLPQLPTVLHTKFTRSRTSIVLTFFVGICVT